MKKKVLLQIVILCLIPFSSSLNGQTTTPVGPGDWSSARMFMRGSNFSMFSSSERTQIKDRYDLVMIEKAHGKSVNGALQSVYSNDLEAAEIRANRPETKVLFYWNSLLLYKHLYQSITDITAIHPDWAEYQPWYTFDYGWDLTNQDALDWWADEAIDVVNNTACNGVFADAARLQQRAQYDTIRNAIDGPVIANCGFNAVYYPFVDGVFVERFVGYTVDTTAEIENNMDGALALPSDMYMTLQGRPENDVFGTDHTFSFACFLIVANDYSYYTYTGPGLYWHADFEEPLGKPLGKGVKNGYVYTRSFEYLELEVNIQTGATNFNWLDEELGIEFYAAGFDPNSESHPNDDLNIRDEGTQVGYIRNDNWIRYDDFNFASGTSSITVSASSNTSGGMIEVRTGSPTGTLLGIVDVPNTGSWNNYQSFSADLHDIVLGRQDLYLVFKGGGGYLMNLRTFELAPSILMAHWSMNEGAGSTVNDITGNGHDATIVGASWDNNGARGSALAFQLEGGGVKLPISAFSSIEKEVTLSMWVNGTTNQPLANTNFEAFAVGDKTLNVHLPWSNSRVYWDAGNTGSAYDRIFTNAAPASTFEGGWNHWVFTKNATTGVMNIYVNGALFTTAGGKTRDIKGITEATFGSSYSGSMDEVMLFNKELTAAEVLELYSDQEDLGVLFGARSFNEESHPGDDLVIAGSGDNVGFITNNSWIRFDDFNFGSGGSSIIMFASSNTAGGTIEIRTGSSTGPVIGSVAVTNTGDWNNYQSFSANFNNTVSGISDLYLVFTGGSGYLMNMGSFQVD